ncbi:beta-ketoacyl synthase [Calothrix sp. NIES-4071]|nr:beta-ketoacyl synthase [Calothrix sp. NIES-4071]BAZ58588.1 beta-ketoacyl synthase [Calothrix sp. NIES-4105]
MSASWIDTALSQLNDEISNCEKVLFKFIEDKKRMTAQTTPIHLNRKLQDNPIAIIGMASLFPQARTLREYWENIINKVDCITDIPDSHWNVDDYYDPNPRTPEDKTYCKRGGFIPYVDFNPIEFGLPPNILEVTDVSQLLSLVVAKEAMEDAGYSTSREFNRDNVGVILGVAGSKQLANPLAARLEYPVWERALKDSGLSEEDTQKIIEKIKSSYIKWDENAFPGMLGNVVAGRIANRLNFGGINCTVDAACASSFGALKMAISELIEGRSDMMVTGGVDTDNSIVAYISFSKTPAVSPSDNVKPFDAKSDGMMLGEGIGMYVLKRLSDAERDGDKIYAVICGVGTSSDGRYKSIYAPRKEGQIKALQRAYDDAGFNPATVGLIEAHGTGTMAGDPTEFGSLREFFGEDNARKQYIAIGSVKSQIGHTKAAAGAASLIKTALALHHKVLPPTINITEPNPKLNIKNSPFYLNAETRPWVRASGTPPRRAGVSSFGFGGTNYHVVLEEYTGAEVIENIPTASPYRIHTTPSEILLSAPSPAQLLKQCEEVLTSWQSEVGEKHYLELVEECKTKEIPLSDARVGFVAESRTEAVKLLQQTVDLLRTSATPEWQHPQGIYYRETGMQLGGKVVALFSGQGSQYPEMGRELVMNFPEMQRLYGYMDSLLLKDNSQPLSEIVFPHPAFDASEKEAQTAALQRTEYTQPAIGMLSAGMYKILQKAGFKSDFTAGHSFGELTALWAAGVFSDEDYCFLVKARGRAMSPPQDPDYDAGAMLAVKEDLSKVEAVLKQYPRVTIANYNSQNQIVLAGPTAEIDKVKQALQDLGYSAILLPVSAAFHTSQIAFAQKAFAIALKSINFQTPKIPVYSNVTGNVYSNEPQTIKRLLETHLANSVLFKQEIENIYTAGGYCFVEFGPKKILTNLVKDILGNRPHLAIALNGSPQKNSYRTLREATVQLRVAGMPLKNLDPYQIPQQLTTETNKGLNFRINGVNYISEKTRKTRDEAMQEKHQVSLIEPARRLSGAIINTEKPLISSTSMSLKEISLPETNGHHPKPQIEPITSNGANTHILHFEAPSNQTLNVTEQPTKELSVPTPSVATETNSLPMQSAPNAAYYQRVLESLEYVLAQFQQNQSENLQVHGLYLNHQKEYAQTFFQLMQQQNTLLAPSTSNPNPEIKPVIMESLERSMMQFHSQQSETLRIHEQYLQHQVEHTKNFFQLIQQEYAAVVDGNITPISPIKVQPVLPPSTSLEIKETKKEVIHVETPVTPVAPVNKIAQPVAPITAPEIPTLPIQPKKEPAIINQVVEQQVTAPIPVAPVAVVDKIGKTAKTPDLSNLSDKLLTITSEKTGYPIEMLELDMDMEADLGIDSIKRVEIMGALQEAYPELPQPNLEELSEKRTIGQIVQYLQSNSSSNVEVATVEVRTTADMTSVTTPTALEVITAPSNVLTQPYTNKSANPEFENLDQTLLAITSEKTGYPIEMLELDMDMEADLGIDSIKRVEIMGALQEQLPDLPKPSNMEEMAELRTIGQIVEYLQKLSGGEKKKHEFDTIDRRTDVVDVGNTIIETGIQRLPAQLKKLNEPDWLDFNSPQGYVVITDDGSATTATVARSLSEKGWKVVVLNLPPTLVPEKSDLPPGIERVTLTDVCELHLQQKLQDIATQYGSVGAFIHIHPLFQADNSQGVFYSQREKAIVKHIFFIAKHLKKSLTEAAQVERACFCTVARLDGAFGLTNKVNFGAIGGGLFGLTKTMIWEWPNVLCRAIDLSPQLDADTSARCIIAELHDPNRYLTEVAYGSYGRVTLIAKN